MPLYPVQERWPCLPKSSCLADTLEREYRKSKDSRTCRMWKWSCFSPNQGWPVRHSLLARPNQMYECWPLCWNLQLDSHGPWRYLSLYKMAWGKRPRIWSLGSIMSSKYLQLSLEREGPGLRVAVGCSTHRSCLGSHSLKTKWCSWCTKHTAELKQTDFLRSKMTLGFHLFWS